MARTNYAQGRDNEYKCMEYMRKYGYSVMRSPQSGGGWDVMAWNDEEVHFIQIKSYREKKGSYRKDFEKLMAVPPTPHCTKSFWVRKVGQRGWETITVLWSNLPCNPKPSTTLLTWLKSGPSGSLRPAEPSSPS